MTMAVPQVSQWILGLIILSLLLYESVDAEIIERPSNTLTQTGNRTTLKCCSRDKNATFTWKKNIPSRKICEGEKCPLDDNYEIDTSVTGCNNLIIVNASERDSTRYECIANLADTIDKAAAYVITYSCGSNSSSDHGLVEGDIVTYKCAVMWKDQPQFHSYWKNAFGNIIKFKHFTERQDHYVYTWTVSLQRPELPAYTWVLEYLPSRNADSQVDSSPATATWTSRKEFVAYPVTNINVSCPPDNACLQGLSDRITCFCTADGYPRPDFFWLDEDGKKIGLGPTLTINSTKQQSKKYTCVATNTIRDTTHREIASLVVVLKEIEGSYDSESTIFSYLKFLSASNMLMLIILVSSAVYVCGPKVMEKLRTRRLQTVCSSPKVKFGVPKEVSEVLLDDPKDQKVKDEHYEDKLTLKGESYTGHEQPKKRGAHPEQEDYCHA